MRLVVKSRLLTKPPPHTAFSCSRAYAALCAVYGQTSGHRRHHVVHTSLELDLVSTELRVAGGLLPSNGAACNSEAFFTEQLESDDEMFIETKRKAKRQAKRARKHRHVSSRKANHRHQHQHKLIASASAKEHLRGADMATVKRFITDAIDIFTVAKDRVVGGYEFLKSSIDQVDKMRENTFEGDGLFVKAHDRLADIEKQLSTAVKSAKGVSMYMCMACVCVCVCVCVSHDCCAAPCM